MGGLGMIAGGLLAGAGSGVAGVGEMKAASALEEAKHQRALALEKLRAKNNQDNTRLADNLATDRAILASDMQNDNWITQQGMKNAQDELVRGEERGNAARIRREGYEREDATAVATTDTKNLEEFNKLDKRRYEIKKEISKFQEKVKMTQKDPNGLVSDTGSMVDPENTDAIATLQDEYDRLTNHINKYYGKYSGYDDEQAASAAQKQQTAKDYELSEDTLANIDAIDINDKNAVEGLGLALREGEGDVKKEMLYIEETNPKLYDKVVSASQVMDTRKENIEANVTRTPSKNAKSSEFRETGDMNFLDKDRLHLKISDHLDTLPAPKRIPFINQLLKDGSISVEMSKRLKKTNGLLKG